MKEKCFLGLLAILLTGCAGEFNKVFKSTDMAYRYEYAKQSFAEGKYSRSASSACVSPACTLRSLTFFPMSTASLPFLSDLVF